MRKIWLFIYFFSIVSFSQNTKNKTIDSLLTIAKTQKKDTAIADLYNQISKQYIYQDSEKGIFYAKKALGYSKKANWKTGSGVSYLNIGMHLVSIGKYNEALANFKISEQILQPITDNYNLAKLYNELGILKANQSKFPEALDYFFKSLKGFENVKNKEVQRNIGSCYENIGTIYNLTLSYEKAIEYYNKAIVILSKIKNKETEVASNIANIGTIYQKQNQLSKAIENYKKAEAILTIHKDDFTMAFVNSWLGSAYLAQKKYGLSIEKSKAALLEVTKSGDKELTALTLQNLGYAQIKNGISIKNNEQTTIGFNTISNSIKSYRELGNKDGLSKGYLYLSDYYTYKKDYSNALKNYQLHSAYNDSIYNSKNKQTLQNLQDQRTIEMNNKQIQLNKITLENKEKQKWYFIFGILLLGIIGSLLFYQSRNRKKTNEKLQLLNSELDLANKTKARFFSILNHDLRSPVSNLIHFLHLQKENPELLDEESKKRMQNKTISGAENLLNSMEDILLWSKGQMENFQPQLKIVSVKSIFEDTQKHFESEENIRILFENPNNIQINTDENYLKTILRNLTGNAIKALTKTDNPKIIWKAWQEENKAFLSISDNGSGAAQEQFKALYDDKEVVGIKTGLGLHLIRDLAKAINCEIRVDSKINQGTTITLSFKQQ